MEVIRYSWLTGPDPSPTPGSCGGKLIYTEDLPCAGVCKGDVQSLCWHVYPFGLQCRGDRKCPHPCYSQLPERPLRAGVSNIWPIGQHQPGEVGHGLDHLSLWAGFHPWGSLPWLLELLWWQHESLLFWCSSRSQGIITAHFPRTSYPPLKLGFLVAPMTKSSSEGK